MFTNGEDRKRKKDRLSLFWEFWGHRSDLNISKNKLKWEKAAPSKNREWNKRNDPNYMLVAKPREGLLQVAIK